MFSEIAIRRALLLRWCKYVEGPFRYRELLKNQWLSRRALEALQNKRLRALIAHSYRNVRYYHTLFKQARITPADIQTVKDLRKIPITTKADLRSLSLEEIAAQNIDVRTCVIRRTSGSTGIPITIPWDLRAWHARGGLYWIVRLVACGARLTHKMVQLGPTDFLQANFLCLFRKLGIYRVRNVSPLDPVETQIRELRRFNPDVLVGYPSAIRLIAAEIRDANIHEIAPHLVFTGGELLDEATRDLFRDVFSAETFNAYGSIEAGYTAYECHKREGLHVLDDLVLVEITKDNEVLSVGNEGEVTVTNLKNFAGPIIRYNLEDIGRLLEDPCSCDRCHPLMQITGGRKGDVIPLPDGRIISTLTINAVFHHIPGIKQHQIIQKKLDRFLVKIVPDHQFTAHTPREIQHAVRTGLELDVEVDVQRVDSIPTDSSGKFQAVITEVQP